MQDEDDLTFEQDAAGQELNLGTASIFPFPPPFGVGEPPHGVGEPPILSPPVIDDWGWF